MKKILWKTAKKEPKPKINLELIRALVKGSRPFDLLCNSDGLGRRDSIPGKTSFSEHRDCIGSNRGDVGH
jgi:hypothetical protein